MSNCSSGSRTAGEIAVAYANGIGGDAFDLCKLAYENIGDSKYFILFSLLLNGVTISDLHEKDRISAESK